MKTLQTMARRSTAQDRSVCRAWARLLLAALLLASAAGCDLRREVSFTGPTMGTHYTVKLIAEPFSAVGKLQRAVRRRLEEVNRSMSTYLPESEISRFNAMQQAGAPFPVSPHFMRVMKTAARVHLLSGGAWDGTVMPLVDLWGFGRSPQEGKVPSPSAIVEGLAQVGFEHIRIDGKGFLSKERTPLSLDLASIAKGYGADEVARVIRERGYRDFLVEIGGEVVAAGLRLDGRPWRVGINLPRPGAAADAVYRVVPLKDRAMATSGDYRNFFERNGRRYSHIIDPRSGYPVDNRVVSVSVLAPDCTLADGLATAVMVMGPEKGLQMLQETEEVQGLIVVQEADGTLRDLATDGFRFLASDAP
jgi:thiamine biosynthesis lipoprotein